MKKQIEYLQKLFYDIWNDFGSVYLLVKYSGNTVIGKRGFTEQEMKQGLILVFNNKTNNKLNWDEEGNITCVLAFGTRKEDLFLHHDDLAGVFSAEAGVQYLRSDVNKEEPTPPPPPPPPPPPLEQGADKGDGNQVVSISNFRKKKSKP